MVGAAFLVVTCDPIVGAGEGPLTPIEAGHRSVGVDAGDGPRAFGVLALVGYELEGGVAVNDDSSIFRHLGVGHVVPFCL